MLNKRKISTIGICLTLAMFAAGCKKKAPPPPPPPPPPKEQPAPPPPPAAPTVTAFAAEPSSIERGQSSTLSWNVTDASSISIDNSIGTVQGAASRRVFPGASTTYTLTATGPGGTKTAAATGRAEGELLGYAFRHRRGRLIRLRQERYPRRCPRRADQGRRRPEGHHRQLPGRQRHHRGPLRRARFGRVQPGSRRPARRRRQGLPDPVGCSWRQAEDHQLRQGTSAVHRPRRDVLSEEPPRALLHRAVKSGTGRAVPAHPQSAGRPTRPAHEEIL